MVVMRSYFEHYIDFGVSRSMNVSTVDEYLAKTYLESFNLEVEHYSKYEHGEKRPDFKVNSQFGLYFFCEVKSVLTETKETGILHKTIYNTISSKIHSASKQFREVNSNHFVPNVLVIVSHNMQINWHSFEEFARGFMRLGETSFVDLTKYRMGRIQHEFREIDLFIWLEDSHTAKLFFNDNNMRNVVLLSQLFNIVIEPT